MLFCGRLGGYQWSHNSGNFYFEWFGNGRRDVYKRQTVGTMRTNSGKEKGMSGYRSRYDKSSEEASAGYYKVLLLSLIHI